MSRFKDETDGHNFLKYCSTWNTWLPVPLLCTYLLVIIMSPFSVISFSSFHCHLLPFLLLEFTNFTLNPWTPQHLSSYKIPYQTTRIWTCNLEWFLGQSSTSSFILLRINGNTCLWTFEVFLQLHRNPSVSIYHRSLLQFVCFVFPPMLCWCWRIKNGFGILFRKFLSPPKYPGEEFKKPTVPVNCLNRCTGQ